VFGVSFPEFLLLGTVALLVLGPEKLPGMLRTMGQWVAKLRKLTTEVRYQSGIDEVLRAEGFDGGLNELRSIVRGGAANMALSNPPPPRPLPDAFVADKSREYPPEGPDAYGALPEDLFAPQAPVTPALPEAATPAQLPAESTATVALAEGTVPAPAAPGAESRAATGEPEAMR
jgi:sec-independent protein translocase protein TatB